MTTVSERAAALHKSKPTVADVEAALLAERRLAVQEMYTLGDAARALGVTASTLAGRTKTKKGASVFIVRHGRKYVLGEDLPKLKPRNDFGPMRGRVEWLEKLDTGDPCQVIWYDAQGTPQIKRGVVMSSTMYNIIVKIDGEEETDTFYRRTGGEFYDPQEGRGMYHLYALGTLPAKLAGVIEPIKE